MEVRRDDLRGEEIVAFLAEHLEEMHRITPPGSVHALDLDGLRAPDVTFWSVWEEGDLVGCGALKEIGPRLGEIKSMRTAVPRRGQGIGARILEHIMAEAVRRGYESLSLETGALAAFMPARTLYERHGFDYCGPFGGYSQDPNSVFMTRRL